MWANRIRTWLMIFRYQKVGLRGLENIIILFLRYEYIIWNLKLKIHRTKFIHTTNQLTTLTRSWRFFSTVDFTLEFWSITNSCTWNMKHGTWNTPAFHYLFIYYEIVQTPLCLRVQFSVSTAIKWNANQLQEFRGEFSKFQ